MPPRKRSPSSAGKSGGRSRSTTKTPAKRQTAKNGAGTPDTPAEVDTFGRFATAVPADAADLADYYGRLITTSRIRVEMLSNLLADEYKRRGVDALRRITYTTTADGGAEPSGEVPTALARLEMDERRTLERLLVEAARLGIDMRNAAARAQQAAMTVAALMAFAEHAGMDQLAPDVRRMMQRAVIDARQAIGEAR